MVNEESLKIPHPELPNRPFFICLMASLSPKWRYPVPGQAYTNLTLDEILNAHIKPGGAIRCFAPGSQLVGIVNVTPDSFSDGGFYFSPEKAFKRIQALTEEGAIQSTWRKIHF